MKKNNYLSDEELEMLFSLSSPEADHSTNPSSESNRPNEKLVALLNKANALHVEANFGHHHLRFPIQIFQEDNGFNIPELGIPEIYEYVASNERSWRLEQPDDLALLDKNANPLPSEIINISTSGLLIRDHLTNLNLGAHFDSILSGPRISLPLAGTIIRNKLQKNKSQEWGIRLKLDAFAYETLQTYIYQQHQAKYLPLNDPSDHDYFGIESP
jgi:hypothetical protein